MTTQTRRSRRRWPSSKRPEPPTTSPTSEAPTSYTTSRDLTRIASDRRCSQRVPPRVCILLGRRAMNLAVRGRGVRRSRWPRRPPRRESGSGGRVNGRDQVWRRAGGQVRCRLGAGAHASVPPCRQTRDGSGERRLVPLDETSRAASARDAPFREVAGEDNARTCPVSHGC